MNILTLPLGSYQTNCYILHKENSKSCCVIDPGYEAEEILDQLEKLGLSPEAILLTHGHFDHVGAVRELAAETGCKVYIHPEEQRMPTAFTAGPLYFTDLYDEMLYIGIPEIGEDGVQIIKPKPVIGKIETWDILLSNGEQIQKRVCINGATK